MATVVELREGLRAALAAGVDTAGLQVSAYMLASPNPPLLQVMGLEEVVYHEESMDGALWTFVVQGFAGGAFGDEEQQRILDGWLANEGSQSVQQALEADPTLGGVCDDVTVLRSSGYGLYQMPGSGATLGTDWFVDVLT